MFNVSSLEDICFKYENLKSVYSVINSCKKIVKNSPILTNSENIAINGENVLEFWAMEKAPSFILFQSERPQNLHISFDFTLKIVYLFESNFEIQSNLLF